MSRRFIAESLPLRSAPGNGDCAPRHEIFGPVQGEQSFQTRIVRRLSMLNSEQSWIEVIILKKLSKG
jgi:hypothetical protein